MNRREKYFFFLLLFGFLFSLDRELESQSTPPIPQLNSPSYAAGGWNQQMQSTYSAANGMKNITNWDALVLQGYGVLQSEWEAQIQAQISNQVSLVHTQDQFQSVQDYKNYVYDALESQASQLLTQWQADAEVSIQLQRNQFIDTYYGGNLATVTNLKNQFDAEFQAVVQGNSPTLSTTGGSNGFLTNSQLSLQQLEQQWYSQYNTNIQNGLWNYEQSLQALNTNYQNLLNQIATTNAQYLSNINQIQSYEANVKDQVKTTMDGYQQFLNGNSLFWNSVNVTYDSVSGTYLPGICPSGDTCSYYLYDTTSGQFVSTCPATDQCTTLTYDNSMNATTGQVTGYISSSCAQVVGTACTADSAKSVAVHTSLNADGQAFQKVINDIETAITQGMTSLAVFDTTKGTLVSYPQSCLNPGESCVTGSYNTATQKFSTSACASGAASCVQAIVDNTTPSALTGMYFSSTCPTGDASCVTCPSTGGVADTCQIQSYEASLAYAANEMSTFLLNEQALVQTNVAHYLNGTSSSTGAMTINMSLFDYQFATGTAATQGVAGLAVEIMHFIDGTVSGTDFSNWLMNAYSASLTGTCDPNNFDSTSPACLFPFFSGAGAAYGGASSANFFPGMTITGVNMPSTNLQAINLNPAQYFNNPQAYCLGNAGCAPLPFVYAYGAVTALPYTPIPGGQYYSNNRTWSDPGYGNFYNYTDNELWGVYGVYYGAATMYHQTDSIQITLSFNEQDNNSSASAATWQNLLTQLQGFSANWTNNVLPAVMNWSGQVANYNAQYATWQTTQGALLAQAQSDYSNALAGLQSSETGWLTQMHDLQAKTSASFLAANNALRDGKSQADLSALSTELLGNLTLSRLDSGSGLAQSSGVLDTSKLFAGEASSLSNVNPNTGLPNFSLLGIFSGTFGQSVAGLTNLSLLSSTNNALLNEKMNYMQQMVSNLAGQQAFTQNGEQQLLQDRHLSTKTVGQEKDAKTFLTNSDGQYVKCDAGGGNCTACADQSTGCETMDSLITSVCGDSLSTCTKYTANKYTNVHMNKDGDIEMDQAVYTGKATYQGSSSSCGGGSGEASDANDYCFNTQNQHLTIKAPHATFMMGNGMNSVGNIFDTSQAEGNRISSVINSSFKHASDFFGVNNFSTALLANLAKTDHANSLNAEAAGKSAGDQAFVAGIVEAYVNYVANGGHGMKGFVKMEVHNLVQNAITTLLVNTYHLSPDVATYLAGGLIDWKQAQHAKHELRINAWKNDLEGIAAGAALAPFGGLFGITGVLTGEAVGPGMGNVFTGLNNRSDVEAIRQWRQDRENVVGLAVTLYGKEHNWPPDQIALAAQWANDFVHARDAKAELGWTGPMLSVGRLMGVMRNLEAPFAEIEGGLLKFGAHLGGQAGLVGRHAEEHFDDNVRFGVNNAKLKADVDAIHQWKTDKVNMVGNYVQQVGKANGWSDEYTQAMVRIAEGFVIRQQARADLRKTRLTDEFALGPLAVLDQVLFKGGIESLVSRGVKGILTTFADVGHSLGLVSDQFRSDTYANTSVWNDKFTGASLQAATQAGKIDKSYIKSQERDLLFTTIAAILDPNGNPNDIKNFGKLLEGYMDQRTAKKEAREQRLKDTEQVIEIAAAAAFSVCTAGAGSGTMFEVLGQVAMNVGRFSMTYGQMIASAISITAQTVIGGELGGTNGAIAGLANGLLGAATLSGNLPVSGFVSWTPGHSENLLTGEAGQKGGWGGGFSANIGGFGEKDMGTIGFTYAPGTGLDVNANYAFGGKSFQMPAGSFVGIDINTKTGNYTVNGGYDFNPGGENHVGMTVSASRDGSANAGAFYNYSKQDPQPEPGSKPVLGADGKPVPPPKSFMGKMGAVGAALTMSNDGTFDLAGQWKGVNVASMSYDTNTHKLGQVHGSGTFFSDFASSVAQENASNNIEKQQKQMDEPTGKLLVKMGMMSDEERLNILNSEGPGKLNEMFDTYKKNMSDSGNIEQWKNQVSAAGDALGMRVQFDEGKSAKTALESAWNRFKGDVFGSFGIANDGSKSYSAGKDEEPSVLRTKTCFDKSVEVKTTKGYKSFGDLRLGDEVYSLNEETGEIEIQKVTELFVHNVRSVHEIDFENKASIKTTWNHPFAIQNRGWVNVEDIHAGDRSITGNSIRTAMMKSLAIGNGISIGASIAGSSNTVRITQTNWQTESKGTLGIRRIEEKSSTQKVYNIEVEKNHNYFVRVGKEDVLVHNYIVDVRLEKIPAEDLAMLSKPNSDPKYSEIKWGDKTYNRVIENGAVRYERQGANGSKEVLRVSSAGYIEQKTVWGGFMGLGGKESKASYYKANEVNIAERNSDKANGVKEEPLAPYEKAADSRYVTDKLSKLWSEKGIDGSKYGFGMKELRQTNSYSKELTLVDHELEFTKANKSQVEGAAARIRKLEVEKSKLTNALDKLYESAKTAYTQVGYDSRDSNGRYTGEFAKFNKEPKEFGSSGQDANLLMNEVRIKAQAVLGFKSGTERARMEEILGSLNSLEVQRKMSTKQNKISREEWIRTATRGLEDVSEKPGESREKYMERLNSVEAGAQDRTRGTAVQLSVAIELLQRAFERGDLKPAIPHDAPDYAQRLENYKKFVKFVEGGWSPELGSKTAAEICRTYTNYLQAVEGKVTKASFVEWYTYKGISGDLGFSQGAPVVDLGHTPGFSKSWGVETEGSNNFASVRLDPKTGELRGIVNPIPLDSLRQKLAEFPVGKVIQVYDDTDNTPGANHFCLWLKTEDGWVNYNHTGGESGGVRRGKTIKFNENLKVFKIYY
ncbi:TIGR04388 family protein [Leptospira fletcheri]|uniref:TIGR04388 family protein n=1 Tax=Leptospira fletcheri TaxID=2484981 RepID=A0A4R9GAP3_9LEPT|nr:TIGR04388 family protein [Leptospira fletcheri]TGK08792.1 TIGR04388 family protein [Leptospira fletcheri]